MVSISLCIANCICYGHFSIRVVPTEPRDLTVMFINSTALDITWEEPLCDYGIRTKYTVSGYNDTIG